MRRIFPGMLGGLAALLTPGLDLLRFDGAPGRWQGYVAGRSPAWRRRKWRDPQQGERERTRRAAQVAKLAARGRDWTGRRIAHG